MKLYKLMELFCDLCFVEVTGGKITDDGFDFTYDGGTYDSCIRDFVERINKEKLVDKEIIDYLIDIKDGKIIIHFYDCDYYNPAKKKELDEERKEQEKIIENTPRPF